MRAVLLMVVLGVVLPAAAEASVLRALKRAAMVPVKVVKRIASVPEYVLIYEAEAIAAWYRYEVCER